VTDIQTEEVREFQKRVMSFPDCERLLDCVNCGACTASCGSKNFMKFGPRSMIRFIVNGEIEQVKTAEDPWLCIECFMCEIKCPKEVRPVHIMRAIREIQFEDNNYPEVASRVMKAKKVQKVFADQLTKNGRLSEFHSALDVKGIIGSMNYSTIATGLDLILHGRIKIKELIKTGLTFTLAGSSYKVEDEESRDQVHRLMEEFYTVNLE
jgi:heterodisulfide reductase subunit C